jgi:hypothetical protein
VNGAAVNDLSEVMRRLLPPRRVVIDASAAAEWTEPVLVRAAGGGGAEIFLVPPARGSGGAAAGTGRYRDRVHRFADLPSALAAAGAGPVERARPVAVPRPAEDGDDRATVLPFHGDGAGRDDRGPAAARPTGAGSWHPAGVLTRATVGQVVLPRAAAPGDRNGPPGGSR